MSTNDVPHYTETKVDVVTTWESDDPLQELVTRYQNVRCPSCNRMLFCVQWEAVGYPKVDCPACGFDEGWPFENHPEWAEFYDHGFTPKDDRQVPREEES